MMAMVMRRLRTGLFWQIALGFAIGTAATLAMRAAQAGEPAGSIVHHGPAAAKPLIARG